MVGLHHSMDLSKSEIEYEYKRGNNEFDQYRIICWSFSIRLRPMETNSKQRHSPSLSVEKESNARDVAGEGK